MVSMELVEIGYRNIAEMAAIIGLVVGLAIGIGGAIFGREIHEFIERVIGKPSGAIGIFLPMGYRLLDLGWIAIILGLVLGPIIGCIVGILIAFVYNVLAMLVGGIVLIF
jgi:hypothetical protein